MCKIVHSFDELARIIGEDCATQIETRFSKYVGLAGAFVIEDHYVDKEWREEFSAFYSFTFYDNASQFTTRIHFIDKSFTESENIDEIKQEAYLGFVVLRPMPVPKRILKAMFVPRKDALGISPVENMYMATCKFESHIGSNRYEIETFPFYCQDSAVTVCAQACMYMCGLYMHKKHRMNRPSFRDFIRFTPIQHARIVPCRGVTPTQMVAILTRLGYNAVLDRYDAKKRRGLKSCLNKIDSCLESDLPPILMYGAHVVCIAGHTLKGNERDYIIFDDSGHHLKRLTGSPHFAYRVTKADLINDITTTQEEVFVLSFEFDRQYFPLSSVESLVKDIQGEITYRRFMVVDSRVFKSFVKKEGRITVFDNMSLPHYLWIVELYTGNKLMTEVMMDASAHRDDREAVIAIWAGNEVKIFKPTEQRISVGEFPFVFPSLTDWNRNEIKMSGDYK